MEESTLKKRVRNLDGKRNRARWKEGEEIEQFEEE